MADRPMLFVNSMYCTFLIAAKVLLADFISGMVEASSAMIISYTNPVNSHCACNCLINCVQLVLNTGIRILIKMQLYLFKGNEIKKESIKYEFMICASYK